MNKNMVKYGDDISVRVIKEQPLRRGQTIDNVSKFAFKLTRPLFHIASWHGLSATLNLFLPWLYLEKGQ